VRPLPSVLSPSGTEALGHYTAFSYGSHNICMARLNIAMIPYKMLFYSNSPGPREGPALRYSSLVLLVVFLIGNSIIPSRLPMRNRHMKEITPLVSSVPVDGSSRTPNNIPDTQFLRFATLIADPARPSRNLEDLSIFVVVPMGPGARSEHDVIDRDSLLFVQVDGVGPDVAGECGASQFGFLARRAGVADNCHRHGGFEIERFVRLNDE
jgi:hypothetical protein